MVVLVLELSLHTAITLQGDDEAYFLHVEPEFQRTPNPLGMASGKYLIIPKTQQKSLPREPETNLGNLVMVV